MAENIKNWCLTDTIIFSVLQNAELKFNFGGEDFKHPPKSGFVALDQAPEGHAVKSSQTGVCFQPHFRHLRQECSFYGICLLSLTGVKTRYIFKFEYAKYNISSVIVQAVPTWVRWKHPQIHPKPWSLSRLKNWLNKPSTMSRSLRNMWIIPNSGMTPWRWYRHWVTQTEQNLDLKKINKNAFVVTIQIILSSL